MTLPGVYAPQCDTRVLAGALRREELPAGAHVLDLGTGSGALAVVAARHAAARVTAVDISRRAVFAARVNARLNGLRIVVRRGDLTAELGRRRFDLIMANPPYVPVPDGSHTDSRWDAGTSGRDVVDRVCAEVPPLLGAGGTLLMVHSALCDVAASLALLRAAGLTATVTLRCQTPFGPVLRRRAAWLRARGLIGPGQRDEELAVIRAQRPA